MQSSPCRVISVASGKGGVGKTSFSLNLAYSIAQSNKRVCIIDADLGLANIDVLLGMSPQYTLEDVIFRNKSLKEIICKIDDNLDLLPGSSGIPALADLTNHQRRELISKFSSLHDYDFIIIDNSPGISPSVLSFCLSTKELIILFTPEPTAITDAYALIKSLKENGLSYPPFLVLNKTKGKEEIKKIVGRMGDVCKKYLNVTTIFLGAVFEDKKVQDELKLNGPVCKLYPDSLSARCYKIIATRILNRPNKNIFFSNLKDVMKQSIVQFTSRIPSSAYEVKLVDPIEAIRSLKRSLKKGQDKNYNKSFLINLREEILDLTKLIDGQIKKIEQKNKIGIVSLDNTMKKLLKEILSDANYNSLDLIDEMDIDLRKLDLIIYHHLPNKELTEELKRIFYLNVPILVLSSFGFNIHHKNIKDFISTPFKIEDFLNKIDRLLNNS